jgi:hypothetical protein
MKASVIISILSLFSFFNLANAQITFPSASPLQTIKQDFGISSVEITYSRPSVKGRRMIGNICPYDSLWRVGANAATKITFNSPTELKGNKVAVGTYAFYAIPTPKDWTIVLNKGVNNWGTDGYKQSDDVLRFTVRPIKNKKFVETLTFEFDYLTRESCNLIISWEKWQVIIPMKLRVTDELKLQVENNLKTEQPDYWAAAQFYNEYLHELMTALEMTEKAIKVAETKQQKPYWAYYYKARILKDLGIKTEAIQAAKIASTLAKEEGNRINYIKLSEELIASLR